MVSFRSGVAPGAICITRGNDSTGPQGHNLRIIARARRVGVLDGILQALTRAEVQDGTIGTHEDRFATAGYHEAAAARLAA